MAYSKPIFGAWTLGDKVFFMGWIGENGKIGYIHKPNLQVPQVVIDESSPSLQKSWVFDLNSMII